ncbi:MAG TPA: inositol monophosphatase [Gammaproteobacteria bacterium]|nr:inositol monophosphatase [Gammaproteobacteria bacterium]
MQPMANMALRAARLAGQHIARAFDRPDLIKVAEKGHNDYVTNIDKDSERIIIESLQATYPDHTFTGEENIANTEVTDAEYTWVIDPIDGTNNFIHNLPHFCISIACLHKGKLEHGIILDPMRQEEFVASRGKGCHLNGQRLRANSTKDFDGALIATGGRGNAEVAEQQTAVYGHLLAQGAVMRQSGSAALDLAYVAAGRLDGMWTRELQLWDMAAGALMVLETGGLLGDFDGGANHLKSGNIVAGTPKIFKGLTTVVKKHLATPASGEAS